jgi:hypothetical protein
MSSHSMTNPSQCHSHTVLSRAASITSLRFPRPAANFLFQSTLLPPCLPGCPPPDNPPSCKLAFPPRTPQTTATTMSGSQTQQGFQLAPPLEFPDVQAARRHLRRAKWQPASRHSGFPISKPQLDAVVAKVALALRDIRGKNILRYYDHWAY